MKLFKPVVLSLIGLLLLVSSCNKGKTYADRLKDERKAIDLFIAKNDLNILSEFPKDGKFASKNDFYKDPYTGVYFNIMELGEPVELSIRDEVYIRFKEVIYLKDNDTIKYNNQEYFTETFYGPVNSSTRDAYTIPGWMVPLSYNVKHTGKARLIIPFDMGSTYDRGTGYQPTFYDDVVYRFEYGY